MNKYIMLPVLYAAALIFCGPAQARAESALSVLGAIQPIAPERRCQAYDRKEYPYHQSIELQIIRTMGGRIYGPYEARTFASRRDTHIEHIVAVSEAHDSGMCAASPALKQRFASDIDNLTLASPGVNRAKSGYDASEWLPKHNQCWYAGQIVTVKKKYELSFDKKEASVLRRILSQCPSTAMVFTNAAPEPNPKKQTVRHRQPGADPLTLYDSNRNGRITCAEAREHRIAPVSRDHPAYRYMRDGDGDGVVCE